MFQKLIVTLGAIFLVLKTCRAEKDDKKWVWGDNNRGGRNGFGSDDREEASSRYEVYENDKPYQNRPFHDNSGEYGGLIHSRPVVPPRPIIPSRPGGIYPENNNIGGYGAGQGNYFPNQEPPQGILTGPIPSWQQEGPYKQFNRCKCSERFNCNSPGLAYGHCDVGKQYCCYSTHKEDQLGGPLPSRPVNSFESGVLVGPGGPVDDVPGVNDYLKPGTRPLTGGAGFRPGSSFRPNEYQRPGGFGFGGRPRPGHFNGNIHSYENGLLVGPGGPFDGPNIEYANGFSGRAANNKKD